MIDFFLTLKKRALSNLFEKMVKRSLFLPREKKILDAIRILSKQPISARGPKKEELIPEKIVDDVVDGKKELDNLYEQRTYS